MSEREIKRRNRPNRYSDEELLDAAAIVFHRLGFHDASMVEIAEEAGATKPTLYARFGGKDEVYDLVMRRVSESLLLRLKDVYADIGQHTTEEATFLPVRVFFEWVREHPIGFQLLFVADHSAAPGVDYRERALAELTEIIGSGIETFLRSRDLRPGRATGLLAAYAVGVLDHGGRWAVENNLFDQVDVAAFTAAFLFDGLAAVGAEGVAGLRMRKRVR